jgi:cation:H+ antiporter
MAVSVGAALSGNADLVVGNVVGSNIYNVLLILGLSALIAPLVVGRQVVRREVPLMVAASLGTIVLALDGSIGRFDGLLLFGSLLVWLVFLFRESRSLERTEAHDATEVSTARRDRIRSVAFIVAGLVMLVVGARWLVDGAVAVASALGLSDLVIALTVVAIGTSLPELATSIIATIRGERDIAVGNVVGSNVFNLLAVLGLSAIVAGEVPIAQGALTFDLPVMAAVAAACLPIFFTGYRIARWEGVLFLGYGVAYTVYLLATATSHPTVPAFAEALAGVIVPLTVVTLLLFVTRDVRRTRGAPAPG